MDIGRIEMKTYTIGDHTNAYIFRPHGFPNVAEMQPIWDAIEAELKRLHDALDTACGLIEDAEKDTNWVSGDPYGDSASVELRATLKEVDPTQ